MCYVLIEHITCYTVLGPSANATLIALASCETRKTPCNFTARHHLPAAPKFKLA